MGDGQQDIVWVSGFISHLDLIWDVSATAATLSELATLGRLIMFDKRGTGLSDRSLGFGSLAERMDDIRAVMDAAGSERATLYGNSEGGPLAILFAATYPERVTNLVLYGTFARVHWSPDYPIGMDPAVTRAFGESLQERWGTGRALRYFIEDAPRRTSWPGWPGTNAPAARPRWQRRS